MPQQLKAGIIGLGQISAKHLRNYRRAEDVELIAAADIDENALEANVDKYRLTGYTDWREMLDSEAPDVISVCTPPALHAEMVVEALDRGVHVLCEKPIAAATEGAEAIVEGAADSDAELMIAYCHRWHPPVRKVKQLIDAETLGKPLLYSCAFAGWSEQEGNHRANERLAGGGALMDNGSHAVDIFQFLFGKIANVSCRAGTFLQEIETDDVATMIFEGENGCFGRILVGYSVPGNHSEFRIAGEKGVIRIDNYFAGPVLFQPTGTDQVLEHEPAAGDRFEGEISHFLAAVRGEVELCSTADTAMHVHKVISGAYRAAENRGIAIE